MPAPSQFPLVCRSVRVVKVIHIQSIWIGTLKNLFTMGIVIYIW